MDETVNIFKQLRLKLKKKNVSLLPLNETQYLFSVRCFMWTFPWSSVQFLNVLINFSTPGSKTKKKPRKGDRNNRKNIVFFMPHHNYHAMETVHGKEYFFLFCSLSYSASNPFK